APQTASDEDQASPAGGESQSERQQESPESGAAARQAAPQGRLSAGGRVASGHDPAGENQVRRGDRRPIRVGLLKNHALALAISDVGGGSSSASWSTRLPCMAAGSSSPTAGSYPHAAARVVGGYTSSWCSPIAPASARRAGY